MNNTASSLRTRLAVVSERLRQPPTILEGLLAQTMPALAAFQLWAGPEAADLVNGLTAKHQQVRTQLAELKVTAERLEQINAQLADCPPTEADLTRELERALMAMRPQAFSQPIQILTFRPFQLDRTACEFRRMGGHLSDIGMPLWKEANNLGQAVHNGFGPWTALLTGTVLFTSFALLENLVGLGESLGLLGLALHALGERQSRRASIQVAIRPLHLRPFPSRLHFELSQQQPEPWVLQMLPPEPTTYLSLGAAEKARLN